MQRKRNSGKKSVRLMRSVALSQLNMLKGLRLTSHASRLAVFMLFAYLTGCAGPQQQVKRRYFWPPLPDVPKVEFVASYRGEEDFPKSGFSSMMESVTGKVQSGGLARPWGIASTDGKVYVADPVRSDVVVFDLVNYKMDVIGKGESQGLFQSPIGVTTDGSGNIYVSDQAKNRVFVFTKDEKPLLTIGDDSTLNWPVGIVVNDSLKRLYVANSHGHNIAVFDLTGKHLFTIGKKGDKEAEFNFPVDADLDSHGNLVVSDSMNARIQVLDPDGKFIRKFGQKGDGATDFQVIKGVAVDRSTDTIYVVDGRGNKFMIFSKEGEPLLSVGGAGSLSVTQKLLPGGFLLPQDMAIDKSGRIYVVDSLNRRIQLFQIVNDEWLKKNPIEK